LISFFALALQKFQVIFPSHYECYQFNEIIMHMDGNINLIFLELLLVIPLIGIVLWFVHRMSKNHNSNIEEIISKVVQEKNESSSKHNLEKIDLTLKPFKEQLRNLNEEIVGLKEEQAASKESFKDHVSKIIEQTDNIGKEARDLALALSGNVQTQGAWGEQVLEKTLEESGLRKDKDYVLQKKFTASDGSTVQPDAVVFMPDNRSIIIDSKASLTSYLRYVDAEDESEKEKHLKEHLSSLKTHIKQLSSKSYKSIEELGSADYILMFIPIESALSLALMNDWDLQKTAMQSKMGFVTPTNLIAILRVAESLWRQDRLSKDAEKIALRAGLMIDKLVGLKTDFEKVKSSFNATQDAINEAEKKLNTGKGNLTNQAKELQEMGARSKKVLADSDNK